jgi:magnesium chelatase subunit I
MAIMRQEARPASIGDVKVTMPGFVEEVIAEFSQQARASSNVNQRSGVSVRLSVSNYESVCANAVRRALRLGEKDVAPRISDVLDAVPASSGGKIEIESMEEGRDGQILMTLVQKSVLDVYRRRNLGDKVRDLIAAFDEGAVVHTGSDIPSAQLAANLAEIPSLRAPVLELTGGNESPAVVASAVEFILDALHLNKRINRDQSAGRSTYRSRA